MGTIQITGNEAFVVFKCIFRLTLLISASYSCLSSPGLLSWCCGFGGQTNQEEGEKKTQKSTNKSHDSQQQWILTITKDF